MYTSTTKRVGSPISMRASFTALRLAQNSRSVSPRHQEEERARARKRYHASRALKRSQNIEVASKNDKRKSLLPTAAQASNSELTL